MEETSTKRPTGMFGFTIVWLGQIISVLASAMSQFGLTIFMFQETGSATALGLMQVFFITPFLIISPIAGVMVDRHNRKMMMMVSDLGAGLATIMILILQSLGILEFWHLYFTSIVYGLGMAFQWPAYSAAITTLVPKEQYGRANGMMSLIDAGPGVIAPLLAGALLPIIGLTGILFFDVATFILAIGALMIVHIPQPPRTVEGEQGKGSIWKEAAYGFKYIFARPSLLGLQLTFFFGNLFAGIAMTCSLQ
jgi:DHA3 family macrolide efflux protein-like MFS transporter